MSMSRDSRAYASTVNSDAAFLFVASGRHRGARVPLQPDSLLVVGGDSAGDVWLSDPGLEPKHVALAVHDNQITVRRLDGEVSLGNKMLDAVATLALADLDSADRQPLILEPGGIQLVFSTDADYCVTASEDTEPSCTPTDIDPKPVKKKFRALAAATAIVSVALVGIALIVGPHNVQAGIEPGAPEIAMQKLIDAMALSDELAVDESFGQLVVRGTLTAEELDRLVHEVLLSPYDAVLRITTAEQLLEQVSGVFRTNGYAATLSYSGDATVVVENLDGDSLEIQKVAAFVRADVANLKKLIFKPSDVPEANGASTAVYLASEGKRLTTIVDGDIAYITTEDGARYFVGSTLPGGHYVRQITDQGVQVNNDDTISWLQF